MNVLFLVMAILVVSLAGVEAVRREDRRRERERRRFAEVPVPRPDLVPVPKFCPCCGRKMTQPVGVMWEITPAGQKELLVCSVCVLLGPLDSIVASAAEMAGSDRQAAPSLGPSR